MLINISLGITATNLTKYIRGFKNYQRAIDNRTEPLSQLNRYFQQNWITNFVEEGALYGSWPQSKRARDEGHQTLLRRGRLLGSLMNQAERGSISSNAMEWTFRNERPQNAFLVSHQFGYLTPTGGEVVPRTIVDFDDDDADYVENYFGEWLEDLYDRYIP